MSPRCAGRGLNAVGEHGSLPAREGSRQADFRPTTAPPIYAQDGLGYSAIVHAHYFLGGNDWLVTEYNPEEGVAFGWACLGDRQNAELGYMSMDELESIAVPVPLRVEVEGWVLQLGTQGVERDNDWPEGLTLTEAIAKLDARSGR